MEVLGVEEVDFVRCMLEHNGCNIGFFFGDEEECDVV